MSASTTASIPPRSRLLCATWGHFLPESGLIELPQTAAGAAAIADCLTSTGVLVDLPTIMSDAPGITCLNAIEDLLARAQETEDAVVIYLASHGLTPTSSQQLYRLATGDTKETDDLIRSIPLDEIIKKLRRANVPLKWLVVDACYSGRAGTTLMGPEPHIQPLDVENLCILASSGPYSPSLAPIDEPLTSFTQALVELLRRGHPSTRSHLSMGEIFDQVKSATDRKGLPTPFLFSQGLTADIPFMPNRHPKSKDTAASGVMELTKYDNRAEILFVDDDPRMREVFEEELRKAGHAVTVVDTPDEARLKVAATYFDIVVVDLFLVGDMPASELITHLSKTAAESVIFVASRESKGRQEESWAALSDVFQYPHRVAAFLFKTSFLDTVTAFADRIRSRRQLILSHIDGLEQWVPFVSGRMTRRGAVPEELSADIEVQTRVCVERLVARWFSKDNKVTDYIEKMTLEPIDSGRSSCAVFALTPEIRGVTPFKVNPLLLKVGPRQDIREEVDRYDKFVQIGVPLELRTDKISSAEVGSVGAIVYSLLGESAGAIVEVGELGTEGVGDCLNAVFNPDRRRWYASSGIGDGVRPLNFFAEHGHDAARFAKIAQVMDTALTGMGLEVDRIARDFCEHPAMNVAQPTTLIHGDLHLGNLLKYGDGRYAMIDYRSVGVGPRLTDFVTLEIACWLQALAPEIPRADLMRQALSAVTGGGLWLDQSESELASWLQESWRLAKLCRSLAKSNCEGMTDMTPAEYGCLLWLCSVRRFEFKSTATTAQERRTMRVLPTALALAGQELVVSG